MKRVLITGITGTLGRELSHKLLADGVAVLGVSRDEQKQRQMPEYNQLRMKIGDVRDGPAIARIVSQNGPIDEIYHLAALKCVDTLEFNPEEALATNVIGTQNVLDIADQCGAKLVFTSTDKACYPINAYGQSKAIAEKMVLNRGQTVVRYGNVLGSRGSFLPSLILSLKTQGKAFITHPEMTRFWMSVGQVANFVMSGMGSESCGIKIPDKIQSSSIPEFVAAVASFCGVERYETHEIGIRPGEKIHETLQTLEENGLITSEDRINRFHPKSLERFIVDVLKSDS